MTDKGKVKEFLTAISKDDYVTANKVFPEVAKSSVQSLINKKKPDVINNINDKASHLVSSSLLDDEKEYKVDEDKKEEESKETKQAEE